MKHLGRGQKIIDDAKKAREKEEKAAASQTLSDISDLDAKVEQEISFYDIIIDEFEPAGEMQDHVVLEGSHAGKVIKKAKMELVLAFFYFCSFCSLLKLTLRDLVTSPSFQFVRAQAL